MLIRNLGTEKVSELLPKVEEVLKCGIYVHYPLEGVSHWSSGLFQILGVEPYSVDSTFESFSGFIATEYRDAFKQSIARALEFAEPFRLEFSMADAKGKRKRI